jgi:hypothetical protein
MPSNRRTEFAPFMLDLWTSRKRRSARPSTTNPRAPAAIGEAVGAVPVLHNRLREGEDMLDWECSSMRLGSGLPAAYGSSSVSQYK